MSEQQKRESDGIASMLNFELLNYAPPTIRDESLTVIVGLGGCGGQVLQQLLLKEEWSREDVVLGFIDYDEQDARDLRAHVPCVSLCYDRSFEELAQAYPQLEMEKRLPCTPMLLHVVPSMGRSRAAASFMFDVAEQSGRLAPLEARIEDAFYRRDSRCARVVLINSLAGSTGSGLFLKVALYLREFFKKRGWSVTVEGAFLLPTIYTEMAVYAQNFNMCERMNANAFAALCELERFNADGVRRGKDFTADPLLKKRLGDLSENEPVIDRVWLFDNKKKNGSHIVNLGELICGMAGALYARYLSATAMHVESMLDDTVILNVNQGSCMRYGLLGFSELKYPSDILRKYCAMKSTVELLSSPDPNRQPELFPRVCERMSETVSLQIEELEQAAEEQWRGPRDRRFLEGNTFLTADVVDAFFHLAEDARQGIDYGEFRAKEAEGKLYAALKRRNKEGIPQFLEALFFEKTVREVHHDGTVCVRLAAQFLSPTDDPADLRVLPLFEVRVRAQKLIDRCKELLSDRYSEKRLEQERTSVLRGRELMGFCPLQYDGEKLKELYSKEKGMEYRPLCLIEQTSPLKIMVMKGRIKEWYADCASRQQRAVRAYGADLIVKRFLQIVERLAEELLTRLDGICAQKSLLEERLDAVGDSCEQNGFTRLVGIDPAWLEAEYDRLYFTGEDKAELTRHFYKELSRLLWESFPAKEAESREYESLLQTVMKKTEEKKSLLSEEDVLEVFFKERDVHRGGLPYTEIEREVDFFRLLDRLRDMASVMGAYEGDSWIPRIFCSYYEALNDVPQLEALMGARLPEVHRVPSENKRLYFLSASYGLRLSNLPGFDEEEGVYALAYDRIMTEMEERLNDREESALLLSPHIDKRFK